MCLAIGAVVKLGSGKARGKYLTAASPLPLLPETAASLIREAAVYKIREAAVYNSRKLARSQGSCVTFARSQGSCVITNPSRRSRGGRRHPFHEPGTLLATPLINQRTLIPKHSCEVSLIPKPSCEVSRPTACLSAGLFPGPSTERVASAGPLTSTSAASGQDGMRCRHRNSVRSCPCRTPLVYAHAEGARARERQTTARS